MKRTIRALLGAGGLLALAAQAGTTQDLELELHIGTAPAPACDGGDAISVPMGTPLNYCFTVTNHGTTPLRYHSLTVDEQTLHTFNANPVLFRRTLMDLPIPPGESRNYHIAAVAAEGFNPRFHWTSFADTPRYTLDDAAPFDTVDLGVAGQPLPAGGGLIRLPFDFTLFGRHYTAGQESLCVYGTGATQFVTYDWECGGLYPWLASDNDSGFSPDTYDSILPHWDLLGSKGDVRYAVTGSAPNRRLVVEWKARNHYYEEFFELPCGAANPATCGITLQLLIDEGGTISFSYPDVHFDTAGGDEYLLDRGGSATIGLVDYSRDLRQIWSENTQRLDDDRTLRWTPQQTAHVAYADARIESGRPGLRVDPGTLRADVLVGEPVATRALSIRNTGTLDLAWNVDERAERSHFPPPTRWTREDFAAASTDTGPQPASATAARGSAPSAPAYAVLLNGFDGTRYARFDTSTPGDVALVQQLIIDVHTGDFVDDDFSRQVWLMDRPGSYDFGYGTLDTANGAIEYRGFAEFPMGTNSEGAWRGMAWDRSTHTLYAMTSTCNVSSGQSNVLYTIDPATGTSTRLGKIETGGNACIAEIAVSPDGALYGVETLSNTLIAIDKTTRLAVPVGPLGFDIDEQQGHSLDFDDADGTLYLAANGVSRLASLYRVDTVTGTATPIAPFVYNTRSFFAPWGLSIANPGPDCANPSQIPWLSLDVTAGTVAPDTASLVQARFDPAGLAPGTYRAELCVHSNDRRHPYARIPVEFHLDVETPIFRDSFEATP